jgi:hypothetical protein
MNAYGQAQPTDAAGRDLDDAGARTYTSEQQLLDDHHFLRGPVRRAAGRGGVVWAMLVRLVGVSATRKRIR